MAALLTQGHAGSIPAPVAKPSHTVVTLPP